MGVADMGDPEKFDEVVCWPSAPAAVACTIGATTGAAGRATLLAMVGPTAGAATAYGMSTRTGTPPALGATDAGAAPAAGRADTPVGKVACTGCWVPTGCADEPGGAAPCASADWTDGGELATVACVCAVDTMDDPACPNGNGCALAEPVGGVAGAFEGAPAADVPGVAAPACDVAFAV